MSTTPIAPATPAAPYRVYFINHDYYMQQTFSSLADALQAGKSKGFDFAVHHDGELLAAWSIIGGARYYSPAR